MSRCRLSASGHPMSDCPTTGRYGASVSMLKQRDPTRSHAYTSVGPCSPTHPGAAHGGARRSSNIVTVSVERVRAPNERLSHHRMIRGQRLNAQTTRSDSLTRVHKRRTGARPRTPARLVEVARRSSNIVTVSVERVRAPNERLSHHRVVRGQRISAQTPRYRPFPRA